MPVIQKYKVKFTNNDVNIKIPIGVNEDFVGYQQEIDNLTNITSDGLINEPDDLEVRRFKYLSSTTPLNLTFRFRNESGTHSSNFTYAGFSQDDITKNSSNFLNSFFIMDFYDTFDINTQTKIFTTYLTNLGTQPSYSIYNGDGSNPANQLSYWYIPISYFVDQKIFSITAYVKFSFYCALENKGIKIFYGDQPSLTTPRKMYVEATLNTINYLWSFNQTTLILDEMNIGSETYKNKINGTFSKYSNYQQEYPDGNTFDYTTGGYSTT